MQKKKKKKKKQINQKIIKMTLILEVSHIVRMRKVKL
jgi:hypothetical protein